MKPLKNKKRFDPRHFLAEKQENTAPKSDFSSLEWSLEEFVVDDPTPKGKPIEKNTKKDLGLPDEVTDKKSRNRERAIADTGMTEGGCGSETPLPALVQGPENLTPDEAYDTGYADAVEEIMNSISHLLQEPVGEPVAIEINEEDEEDDFHHDFVSLVGDEEIKTLAQAIIKLKDGHGIKKKDDDWAELEALEAEFSDLVGKKMNVATDWKVQDKLEDKILKKIKDDPQQNIKDKIEKHVNHADKMMRSGASSEETMAYLRKQGVVVEEDKEAMNEQPSIEDMMKKSIKNAPYADMPTMEVTLNRKEPGVKETVPMVDSARSKNPEALKDIIRNWLRVGYGVDEVELTSDGQTVDVAEFLDIDPMEEQ